jgi:putative sigma-54 modulation protein
MIGRHIEVTDPVKAYLTERRDKLVKFFDRIHSLKIVIDHDGSNHTAEFVAHLVKAEMVISKGAAPDLFVAIDQASDRMEAQLRRYKEKLRAHRAKPEGEAPAQAVPAEEEAEEEQ